MTIAKLGKGNQKRKYRNIYGYVFYRKFVEQSKAKSNVGWLPICEGGSREAKVRRMQNRRVQLQKEPS
jgi:hypothetical protein